jgi:predicted YcjX-like family ATPase
MAKLTNLGDDALIVFDNLVDISANFRTPTIRLGVTGLSRSGKTVFITSLVHALVNSGKLPMFEPKASGRISGARLEPQPSMNLPRFSYEEHLALLTGDRQWPKSTSSISELRITIAYESASAWNRALGSGKLNIDIVDYPGEWLLDLPLLAMDYPTWSNRALKLSKLDNRVNLSASWRRQLEITNADAPLVETEAINLAHLFTEYLRACREDENALSTLPPGRFLMPGDMEGSPALTFCPLPARQQITKNSLYAHMAERYEAYKTFVIKPFFRDHFARLDRQIILVDALQAINAGPPALNDLENALAEILGCFNPGQSNWLTSIFTRKIDRILFAATKVDHLHQENHKALENVLRKLVDNASKRAKFAGAGVNVVALASLRSTSEATLSQDGEMLPVIVGTPINGEIIAGVEFDGETETAIFPGDLPQNPSVLFDDKNNKNFPELSFVRFRPPELDTGADNVTINLPHIRLDKALQFLLSDQLA